MRLWKKAVIVSLILIFIMQMFSPIVLADDDIDSAMEAAAEATGRNNLGTLDSSNLNLPPISNQLSTLGNTALNWGLGILYLPLQYIIGLITTLIEIINRAVTGLDGVVTPGDVIFNNVKIVDINFFAQDPSAPQFVQTVRENVAGWYYGIRTIAIIALLAVLIYISIRMVISTTGEEKGRYKEIFKDWVVSFALLFVLHYIMMLIIYGNNALVDVFKEGFGTSANINQLNAYMENMRSMKWDPSINIPVAQKFGANVVCLLMAGLTLGFIIMYLKRFIVIAFLMIIAPIITITYSIDKVRDRRSQALDTWRKEFFWTVLIQPFHCLIYLVFVPASLQLLTNGDVGSSFLAIFCIIFILQAEDIVQKIFQIDTKDVGRLGAASALVAGGVIGSLRSTGKVASNMVGNNGGKEKNKSPRTAPTQQTPPPTNPTSPKDENGGPNIAPSNKPNGGINGGQGSAQRQTNTGGAQSGNNTTGIDGNINSNANPLTKEAIAEQNEKFMKSDKYRGSWEKFANALRESKSFNTMGKIIKGYTKAGIGLSAAALSFLDNPSGGKALTSFAAGYGLGELAGKGVEGVKNVGANTMQNHVDSGRLKNRKEDFDNAYREYIEKNNGTPEKAEQTITRLMDADLNTINEDTKGLTDIERKMAASAQRLYDQLNKMEYDEPLEEVIGRIHRKNK